jgi:hypothetical protein
MERYKTDEMKRILADIKDRLNGQLPMAPPHHHVSLDSPPLTAANSTVWGQALGLQPGAGFSVGHMARGGAGPQTGGGADGVLPTPFQTSQNAMLLGIPQQQRQSSGGHSPQHQRVKM